MIYIELERDVEGYLVREVMRRGGICLKFIPDDVPGMPDRMVLLPGGRLVWVETKRSDGKVRKLQEYQHMRLKKLGQEVWVVYTKEAVDNMLSIVSG